MGTVIVPFFSPGFVGDFGCKLSTFFYSVFLLSKVAVYFLPIFGISISFNLLVCTLTFGVDTSIFFSYFKGYYAFKSPAMVFAPLSLVVVLLGLSNFESSIVSGNVYYSAFFIKSFFSFCIFSSLTVVTAYVVLILEGSTVYCFFGSITGVCIFFGSPVGTITFFGSISTFFTMSSLVGFFNV